MYTHTHTYIYIIQVWGAAQVLSMILDNNGVCQEIGVATPLELPMSDKPPEQVRLYVCVCMCVYVCVCMYMCVCVCLCDTSRTAHVRQTS